MDILLTLDSGMNAAASLYATDVMKYTKHEEKLMLKVEKGNKLTYKEQLEKHLLDARGVFWGVLIAFFVGLPLFIYSNIINKPVWIVLSALFVVLVTLVFCLLFPKKASYRTSTII